MSAPVRTAAVLTTLALGAALPAAAGASSPTRVPPWPAITVTLPAGMQPVTTTTTAEFLPRMRTALAKRVQAPGLGRNVSVLVADLASGARQFSYNSRRTRVPASTQKTATALAVLSARGADHRMRTKVVRSADGSTVTLVGSGDPLLTSSNLDAIARRAAGAILASGTPAGRLRLVFDDSLFAPASMPTGWYSSYYSAYAMRPTALSRDLRRSSDPSRDAAIYFRSRLKAHGVPMVAGAQRGKAPDGSELLVLGRGHTVAEAVWPMLQYSDNSIAEIMIRHVAVARGMRTTSAGAADAVRAELAKLDIPMQGVRVVDGSGLSRADTQTAASLVAITRATMDPDRPELATGFQMSAVPLAGLSGTLGSRYHDRGTSCATGRVMAKTGTLSDTVALSGIANSADGRLRAFAILVNRLPGSVTAARYRVDRIATAITGCG